MNECDKVVHGNLLDRLIVALCADYARRKSAIDEGRMGRRVRMEYAYVNSRILEAAGEVSGGALAEIFIKDIGDGTGYALSEVSCMSEGTYKAYKKQIKSNIARKLSFID